MRGSGVTFSTPLTLLAQESSVVVWSAQAVAVVQTIAKKAIAVAVVAGSVVKGANTIAVSWGGVVGGDGWSGVGDGSNSWGSVDGGGDWGSVGNGGDSWGGRVGGHCWGSVGNSGYSWSGMVRSDGWGSVDGGGDRSGGVAGNRSSMGDGGHGWSSVGDGGNRVGGTQADAVAASSDEGGGEGARGQSQEDARTDLETKGDPLVACRAKLSVSELIFIRFFL
ncbi:hypothetical protein V5799_019468 [Amblyomma americanum]|uniref:Uncharacterized protein n=1 Tax=Amblyomma americanum TaxID=6943 RepID=A0AAQ4EWS9_AMBAM